MNSSSCGGHCGIGLHGGLTGSGCIAMPALPGALSRMRVVSPVQQGGRRSIVVLAKKGFSKTKAKPKAAKPKRTPPVERGPATDVSELLSQYRAARAAAISVKEQSRSTPQYKEAAGARLDDSIGALLQQAAKQQAAKQQDLEEGRAPHMQLEAAPAVVRGLGAAAALPAGWGPRVLNPLAPLEPTDAFKEGTSGSPAAPAGAGSSKSSGLPSVAETVPEAAALPPLHLPVGEPAASSISSSRPAGPVATSGDTSPTTLVATPRKAAAAAASPPNVVSSAAATTPGAAPAATAAAAVPAATAVRTSASAEDEASAAQPSAPAQAPAATAAVIAKGPVPGVGVDVASDLLPGLAAAAVELGEAEGHVSRLAALMTDATAILDVLMDSAPASAGLAGAQEWPALLQLMGDVMSDIKGEMVLVCGQLSSAGAELRAGQSRLLEAVDGGATAAPEGRQLGGQEQQREVQAVQDASPAAAAAATPSAAGAGPAEGEVAEWKGKAAAAAGEAEALRGQVALLQQQLAAAQQGRQEELSTQRLQELLASQVRSNMALLERLGDLTRMVLRCSAVLDPHQQQQLAGYVSSMVQLIGTQGSNLAALMEQAQLTGGQQHQQHKGRDWAAPAGNGGAKALGHAAHTGLDLAAAHVAAGVAGGSAIPGN